MTENHREGINCRPMYELNTKKIKKYFGRQADLMYKY
jgi:hypothetical protein